MAKHSRKKRAGDGTITVVDYLGNLAVTFRGWLRDGYAGNYDEPMDAAGKRVLRCVLAEVERCALEAIPSPIFPREQVIEIDEDGKVSQPIQGPIRDR